MRRVIFQGALCVLVTFLFALGAAAQTDNTACTNAGIKRLMPNEPSPPSDLSDMFIGTANEQRWFRIRITSGRSYSFYTSFPFDDGDDARNAANTADVEPDSVIELFDACGGVSLGQNDDAHNFDPPVAFRASRVNFEATPANLGPAYGGQDDVFLEVTGFAGFFSFTSSVAIVETTLFGQEWFTGGDFDTFIILQNTTDVTQGGTIYLANINDAPPPLITQTFSIPANSSLAFGTRGILACNFPTDCPVDVGTITVAHTAPPGGLKGYATITSPSSSIPFSYVFQTRGIH